MKRLKKQQQKRALYNIENLFKARNGVINFFEDYLTIVSESKFKATHEKWFKAFAPKQKFQRFPIALSQLKEVNTSENLLNEIYQIKYFLCKENYIL